MKDGSRVVVVRPSFSETWAFFVRKFDVKRATLEQLITIPGKEDAISLLKFLVKGARIIALTGEQGSGKTTMLMGMIENIYENNEHKGSRGCIRASLKKNISNKKTYYLLEKPIQSQDKKDLTFKRKLMVLLTL